MSEQKKDHVTGAPSAEQTVPAHTKGPWHFHARHSGSENHRGFRVYGPGVSGWGLAEVMPVDEDGKEGEANARLIAEAPNLLKALQLAVRQNSNDMVLTGEELRLCEAAISKALSS